MNHKLKIKIAHPDIDESFIPAYQTSGAAGMDLKSAHDAIIPVGKIETIDTGLIFELPDLHPFGSPTILEIQVRPRSGLAAKHGITVNNSPATIDADYRGTIKVILINHGDKDFQIKKGDRIAQAVICQAYRFPIQIVTDVSDTVRGENGIGSTGI